MMRQLIHILIWIFRFPYDVIKHNRVSITSSLCNQINLNSTSIGKYSYIGSNCSISHADIGNYCCIASNVVIGGMEHPYWDLSMSPKLSNEYVYGNKTIIGHDVWIATGCIIKQGIKIGNGAVIGAGSFVNKDVEPYSIVVGTPATKLKFRKCKNIESKLNESEYWKYSPKKAKQILTEIKKDENE